MKLNEYEVELQNGVTIIYAMNEEQAIILAQAAAINKGQPYKLVFVRDTESLN